MKKLQFILMLVIFTALIFLAGCYSCQTCNHLWGKGERSSFPPDKFFWDKDCKKICKSSCGDNQTITKFPYGKLGIIQLEEILPPNVTVNSEFNYIVKVSNLTNVTVRDVVVTENLPDNFKYVNSAPATEVEGKTLRWTIDSISPGEVKTLLVTGVSPTTECVRICGMLSYRPPISETITRCD